MRKLAKIDIGEARYDILCDLNALEVFQEAFGSVQEFERQLIGLRYIADKNGGYLLDANGKPQMEIVEPSIKAVRIALVTMIDEAMLYNASMSGSVYEPVDEMEILGNVSKSFQKVSRELYEEYKRCFSTKKSTAREPRKRATR